MEQPERNMHHVVFRLSSEILPQIAIAFDGTTLSPLSCPCASSSSIRTNIGRPSPVRSGRSHPVGCNGKSSQECHRQLSWARKNCRNLLACPDKKDQIEIVLQEKGGPYQNKDICNNHTSGKRKKRVNPPHRKRESVNLDFLQPLVAENFVLQIYSV